MSKSNQQKLDDIHWETSNEGRDFVSRRALGEVTYPNAWGDRFPIVTIINGIERRVAESNAIQTNLIAALHKVAGGEAFDEAKLLEGVRAAAKAGAQEGASEAFADGIELTAKVKGGE